MKKIFFMLLMVAIACQTQAQGSKVTETLKVILGSNFLSKFDSIANVVETAGADAKNNKFYTDEEKQHLQTLYKNSADKFNGLLTQIKFDFTDRKKLRLMFQAPKTYDYSYKHLLDEADEYYKSNFLQEVKSLNKKYGIEGFIDVATITAIIKIIGDIIVKINEYRRQIKKFTEDLLEDYLVRAHKVQPWSEL